MRFSALPLADVTQFEKVPNFFEPIRILTHFSVGGELMKNDKQPKWSGKTQPNGRQPDHQNQSGPPHESLGGAEDDELPQQIVDALQSSNRQDLVVPDPVRAAILQDAADVLQRTIKQPRKSNSVFSRRWVKISGVVLASAVLVALVLPNGPLAVNEPEPIVVGNSGVGGLPAENGMRPPSGKDVDGNGQVDILDAFLLAKSIEQNESSKQFELASLDQNGDGVVDSDDVDSIVMSVVML